MVHSVRIGIDIRKLHDFGIGTYIRNLLARFAVEEPDYQYVLLHARGERLDTLPDSMELSEEMSSLYSLKEPFSLGSHARRARLDLLHCPHYVTPFRAKCKLVVTIHDLIHLLFPEYLPSIAARLYARYFLKRAVRRADLILTVSETSKRDILEHLPARAESILVTPNGIEPAFFEPVDDIVMEQVLKRMYIQRPYVLYVGNNKPHKNLSTAIAAFRMFRKQAGAEWKFVLAGSTFKNAGAGAAMLRQIEEGGLSESVIFTGYLETDDLVALYSGASLFLFPSLYEGFGLPPLEAMAAGVPVVSSNRSSLPEILGDSALLVDPQDEVMMMEAMLKIIGDSDTRDKLISRGKRQAEQYTWSNTARLTLQGYRKVMERS
jgi:alpha-1,3-rhamnosyl/mannosyltransferase